METLKDIFVPYDIAAQLEGIGFDESCIAGYCLCQGIHPMLDQMILNIEGNNGNYDISAPTYEQVFKWFRSNHIEGTIVNNFGYYIGKIDNLKTLKNFNTCSSNGFEFVRDVIINKMIEVYKKQQQNEYN